MRQEIISHIVSEVREQMYQCLFAGMDRMWSEVVMGEAVINVEIHEVYSHSFEIADVQCVITHDVEEHKSPLLEQAIIDALPDWYEMKHKIMEGSRLSA